MPILTSPPHTHRAAEEIYSKSVRIIHEILLKINYCATLMEQYIPALFPGDRLSEFYIGVGSSFDNATEFDPTSYNVCWYQNSSVSEGETWVFTCTEAIEGRYVTIYFPTTKTQVLTLCEVQVTNSKYLSTGVVLVFRIFTLTKQKPLCTLLPLNQL